jgi:integrase
VSLPAPLAPVPGAAAAAGLSSAAGWLEWLHARLDAHWRAGEWDGGSLLFTGDLASPRTSAWPCRTPGCPTGTRRPSGRCDGCRRARVSAGTGWDEFDAAPPARVRRPLLPDRCTVPGCEGDLHCSGLCFRHERSWGKNRSEPVAAFIARARPLRRAGDCLVAGCGRENVTRRGLCRFHDQRLQRAHAAGTLSREQLAAWIAAERPRLGVHQFSLAGLPELVQAEVLFALQRRDHAAPPLDPTEIRILLARLDGAASVREADPWLVCESGGMQYNTGTRGLFRDLRRHLDQAWAQYAGTDPFAGDIWQVALLGLHVNASRRWPATNGVIDLRVIEPAWLREIVKDWARTSLPWLQRLRETIRACQAASAALAGTVRASLGAGDFTRVLDAITCQRRPDGALYSAAHRNLMIYQFCQVIEHGRGSGLMEEVPGPFRPAPRHRVRQDANEDETGKALPPMVIAQLDARLDLLGPDGRAGAIPAASMQLMHQTIYQILRDTGRRPGEVVTLHSGCIEIIDGQHNLIYDNHKAGRMRRRLPVTSATAAITLAWEQHRGTLRLPPDQDRWMFPSPLLRANQARGHITPSAVARAFKIWVTRAGVIDSELAGPDGTPLPFDLTLIAPYALRHSYAQRHADAGVPVDVLKELMDHASVTTTVGYYQIGLKRKQQAIRAVGALATDAAGNPAPFTSPAAYETASVSVPFGNCTEPSNVNAGGGSCPIRFQCAGCGFYRPDPSYLPALEAHIASLRADRETAIAIGAAAYVTTSLTAEIDAFTNVADQMRHRLDTLPAAEREEIEQASKLLRRARAARQLPVIPRQSA